MRDIGRIVARYGRTLIAQGTVAVLFGTLAFLWPRPAIGTLLMLFGTFAIVEGATSIASGIERIGDARWWAPFLAGLLSIVAGIAAFIMPGLTIIAIVWIIAAWALARGVLELIAAFWLRKHVRGEWTLALAGALSIAFGVFLIANPNRGAFVVVWWIAAYALIFGALLISGGLRLRTLARIHAA